MTPGPATREPRCDSCWANPSDLVNPPSSDRRPVRDGLCAERPASKGRRGCKTPPPSFSMECDLPEADGGVGGREVASWKPDSPRAELYTRCLSPQETELWSVPAVVRPQLPPPDPLTPDPRGDLQRMGRTLLGFPGSVCHVTQRKRGRRVMRQPVTPLLRAPSNWDLETTYCRLKTVSCSDWRFHVGGGLWVTPPRPPPGDRTRPAASPLAACSSEPSLPPSRLGRPRRLRRGAL